MTKTSSAKIPKASSTVQEFLSETFLESYEHGRVSLRALSERLDVTPPAVSRMAQRLARQGLLRREGACGLALSESGHRIAMKTIRKRRVFEAFLVKKMGYTWDEVYPIAAKTSSHLDDELVDRMYDQAGHPSRCPHGDSIPNHDGTIEEIESVRMSDAPDGTSGKISRVASHDGELLRYLGSLNLKPGANVSLISRAPFAGPLRVRVINGSFYDDHVIGAELAEKIWIE
jgi:DtxR family Mn-dependent transcriptional regulator